MFFPTAWPVFFLYSAGSISPCCWEKWRSWTEIFPCLSEVSHLSGGQWYDPVWYKLITSIKNEKKPCIIEKSTIQHQHHNIFRMGHTASRHSCSARMWRGNILQLRINPLFWRYHFLRIKKDACGKILLSITIFFLECFFKSFLLYFDTF